MLTLLFKRKLISLKNKIRAIKGWNIVKMNYRRDKVAKYGAFRAKMNKGLLKSYIDDNLKIELNAMEVTQGTQNTIIRHAPGYTDDLVDSFIMSCYFYIEEEGGVKYWDMDEVDDYEYDKKKVLHSRRRNSTGLPFL